MAAKIGRSGLAEEITIERPAHRLERLRAWMDAENVDCVAVFGADNVNYLGGYWRYYGGPAGLVVGRDGERTLVVMRDEVAIAQRLGDTDAVVGYGERGFGIVLNPLPILASAVAGVPALAAGRTVGIADGLGGMTELLGGCASATLLAADAELVRMRLLKDEDELGRMLHAYELCWLGQRAVGEGAATGESEIEMFTAAQSAAQVAHGEPIEFVADLLAGENAAAVCCPIHVAGERRAQPGDPVIADIVVRADGYWGDTAETHVGDSNTEAQDVRTALLDILEQARTELVPGNTGAEVFRAMDARIREAFPDGEFPHHGGHALGLTSFEDPHLIPSDDAPLESWMVIAVEPGVYFSGRFGARVENVFIVTPQGGVELREAMGALGG
jgi:Xaa-Pro dipeptidase